MLVMIGLLRQWPTIPTLALFPVLVVVYQRLAAAEERKVAHFGRALREYAAATLAFVPRHRLRSTVAGGTDMAQLHDLTGRTR